jgi:hypothetical protein
MDETIVEAWERL